jgi:protein transport protein SEC61 subunit alpha
MKLLHLIRPILPILPEIEKPTHKIPKEEKALWTALALLIYMVCSNLPLYGVIRTKTSDPFYWMRVILASNRGTLMELGVSPLVSTGMVLQLLAGSKVIEFRQDDKEDRVLFTAAQKVVGLFTTLVMSGAYVLSGMYGDITAIGMGNALLIVGQLFMSGLILLLLDEMLQKGYGYGSGISLFIAAHISETILWKAFSPTTINIGNGTEFEGAVLAFFHLMIVRPNKILAIREGLYRQHLPNLTNLLSTCLIFALCIYMQGWKVLLNVKSARMRGAEHKYPIKLFYTSNMPIILQTAMVSNLYFISQMLYTKSPGSIFTKFVGTWAEAPSNATSLIPTGGLAYYVSPPTTLSAMFRDPFHAVFYLMFTLTACAIFGRMWTEVSGTSVRDVARKFKEQQVVMKGHRDTATSKVLSRYIPIAAALGGVCIGVLTVLADYMGAIGSGTGILLTVTIIYEFYEAIMVENQEMLKALGYKMGM